MSPVSPECHPNPFCPERLQPSACTLQDAGRGGSWPWRSMQNAHLILLPLAKVSTLELSSRYLPTMSAPVHCFKPSSIEWISVTGSRFALFTCGNPMIHFSISSGSTCSPAAIR